ncbi:MAG TPA: hypothetical protein DCK98_06215 [Chloroflexi bacterium]|nr:hypothetical protein [Chloroflexota bacterium]HAL27019.1 hypothetical protein [Chloroflexota bacterium]
MIALFTAQRGSADDLAYQAGTCNIGREEIARRRRAGHSGTIVAVVLLAILTLSDAPPAARLFVALPAAAAAAGYLQASLRFCAAYGFRGLFNLGPLGRVAKVADVHHAAQDRARALQIALAAGGIGLVTGVAAFLLPL